MHLRASRPQHKAHGLQPQAAGGLGWETAPVAISDQCQVRRTYQCHVAFVTDMTSLWNTHVLDQQVYVQSGEWIVVYTLAGKRNRKMKECARTKCSSHVVGSTHDKFLCSRIPFFSTAPKVVSTSACHRRVRPTIDSKDKESEKFVFNTKEQLRRNIGGSVSSEKHPMSAHKSFKDEVAKQQRQMKMPRKNCGQNGERMR